MDNKKSFLVRGSRMSSLEQKVSERVGKRTSCPVQLDQRNDVKKQWT